MRKHNKRTCGKCHRWKPRNLYAKHVHNCMGGKPITTSTEKVGGTGKAAKYKTEQK
jgi:hypothetical protein